MDADSKRHHPAQRCRNRRRGFADSLLQPQRLCVRHRLGLVLVERRWLVTPEQCRSLRWTSGDSVTHAFAASGEHSIAVVGTNRGRHVNHNHRHRFRARCYGYTRRNSSDECFSGKQYVALGVGACSRSRRRRCRSNQHKWVKRNKDRRIHLLRPTDLSTTIRSRPGRRHREPKL